MPEHNRDGEHNSCTVCGGVHDQWTLDIMNEVKREQAECKRILGYVPDYKEAKEKGLAK